MKMTKYIIGSLAVLFILSLAACEDEFVRESTHTDASALVEGSYTGTLSLDTNTTFSGVTVLITKIEADTVQAVTVNIKAPDFNYSGAAGMDLYTNINVARANDGYEFSSGFSATLRLIGRLHNNQLYMKFPIQVRSTNKEVRFHTNGNDWVFTGTKN
jgi:hypothetical protein